MSGVRSPPKSEKDRIIRACEEGNLEDAVGNLERWKNDGDIVLAALEAVFNEDPDQLHSIRVRVSCDPVIVAQIVGLLQSDVPPARIVTAIVNAIESNNDNSDLAAQAFEVLADLSKSDHYRHIVMANGCPESCFAAMESFSDDTELIGSCLSILKECTQAGGGQRRRLVEIGLLKALGDVCSQHVGNETVMSTVITILQYLVAYEDTQKKHLIVNGLFKEVTSAMATFPHNEQLCNDGVVYCYFMAEDIVKAARTNRFPDDTLKQIIRCTISTMWSYGSNQDIQSHGVGSLAVYVELTQYCAVVASLAGCGACVTAVTTFPTDVEMAEDALLVFATVCSHPDGLQQLCSVEKASGVSRIMNSTAELMCVAMESPEAQTHGQAILAALSGVYARLVEEADKLAANVKPESPPTDPDEDAKSYPDMLTLKQQWLGEDDVLAVKCEYVKGRLMLKGARVVFRDAHDSDEEEAAESPTDPVPEFVIREYDPVTKKINTDVLSWESIESSTNPFLQEALTVFNEEYVEEGSRTSGSRSGSATSGIGLARKLSTIPELDSKPSSADGGHSDDEINDDDEDMELPLPVDDDTPKSVINNSKSNVDVNPVSIDNINAAPVQLTTTIPLQSTTLLSPQATRDGNPTVTTTVTTVTQAINSNKLLARNPFDSEYDFDTAVVPKVCADDIFDALSHGSDNTALITAPTIISPQSQSSSLYSPAFSHLQSPHDVPTKITTVSTQQQSQQPLPQPDVDAVQLKIGNVTAEKSMLDKQLIELECSVATVKANIATMQQQHNDVMTQSLELQQQVSTRQSEIVEKQALLRQLQAELDGVAKASDEQQQRLQLATATRTQLDCECSAVESAVEAKTVEVLKLKQSLASVDGELETIRTQVVKATAEVSEQQQLLQEAVTTRDNLQRSLEVTKVELGNEQAELLSAIQQLKAEKTVLLSEVASLHERVVDCESTLTSHQQQQSALTADLQVLDTKRGSLLASVNDLREKQSSLESACAALEGTKSQLEASVLGLQVQSAQHSESAERELLELSNKVTAMKSALSSELKELESTKAACAQEQAKLQSDSDVLQAQLSEEQRRLTSELASIRDKSHQLCVEFELKQAKVTETTAQLQSVTGQLETVTASVTHSSELLKQQLEQQSSVDAQLKGITAECARVQAEIDAKTSDIAKLKVMLTELEIEGEIQAKALDDRKASIVSEHSNATAALEEVHSRLEAEFSERKASIVAATSQLEAAITEASQRRNEVYSKHEALLCEIEKLEGQTTAAESKLASANADKEAVESALSEVQLETERLRAQLSELRGQQVDVSALLLSSESQLLLDRHQQDLQQFEAKQSQLVETVEAMKTQLERAAAEMAEKQSALDTTQQQLATANECVLSLQQQLSTKESQLSDLQSALEHAQTEGKLANERVTATQQLHAKALGDVGIVQAGKEAAEEKCRQLSSQLQHSVTQCDTLRGQLSEAHGRHKVQLDVLEAKLADAISQEQVWSTRATDAATKIAKAKEDMMSWKTKYEMEQEITSDLQTTVNALKARLKRYLGTLGGDLSSIQVSKLHRADRSSSVGSLSPSPHRSNTTHSAVRSVSPQANRSKNVSFTDSDGFASPLDESGRESDWLASPSHQLYTLHTQVQSANGKIQEVTAQLIEANGRISECESAKLNVLREIEEARAVIAAKDDVIGRLETANESLRLEVSKLQCEVSVLETDRSKLQSALQHRDVELAEKTGLAQATDGRVMDLKDRCAQLDARLTELDARLAESESRNHELNCEVDKANAQLVEKSNECRQVEQALIEALNRAESASKDAQTAAQSANDAATAAGDAANELQRLFEDKDGLENELRSRTMTIVQLEHQIGELQVTNDMYKRQLELYRSGERQPQQGRVMKTVVVPVQSSNAFSAPQSTARPRSKSKSRTKSPSTTSRRSTTPTATRMRDTISQHHPSFTPTPMRGRHSAVQAVDDCDSIGDIDVDDGNMGTRSRSRSHSRSRMTREAPEPDVSTLKSAMKSIVKALYRITFELLSSAGSRPGELLSVGRLRKYLSGCGLLLMTEGSVISEDSMVPSGFNDILLEDVQEAMECVGVVGNRGIDLNQFVGVLNQLAEQRFGPVVSAARRKLQGGRVATLSRIDAHFGYLGAAWPLAHYHLLPYITAHSGDDVLQLLADEGVTTESIWGVHPLLLLRGNKYFPDVKVAVPPPHRRSNKVEMDYEVDDTSDSEFCMTARFEESFPYSTPLRAPRIGTTTTPANVKPDPRRASMPAAVKSRITQSLDDVDTILMREQRTLLAIFKYYSLSEGRPTSNTQESLTVHCDSMLKFAVDFGIVPDVCTQQAFQRILLKCCGSFSSMDSVITFKQFLMCLTTIAFQCYTGAPAAQVLALLQAMDVSGGKDVVNSSRTAVLVPKFNLQPVDQ